MPLRLYRRVRIAPGVRLNVSRSGPSLSLGPRGAHITVGHNRTRATVGVPGSGISYSIYSHRRGAHVGRSQRDVRGRPTPVAAGPPPPMPPSAKIVLGIALTCLLITAPIGIPLLIVGLVQRSQPLWRARALIREGDRRDGSEALALYEQACAIAPSSEPLVALGDCLYHQGRWADAAWTYSRCLPALAEDWTLRGHHAHALLMAGWPDAAIPQLQEIRARAPLTDESAASITANLAIAFLAKADAAQALAIVRTAPLQRHALGEGLQQCLFVRAVAEYELGHHARAIADLDRLYAVAPGYEGLEAAKAGMSAGSFDAAVTIPPVAAARAAQA